MTSNPQIKHKSFYNKDATPFIPSRKLSLPTYLEGINESDSSSNNSPTLHFLPINGSQSASPATVMLQSPINYYSQPYPYHPGINYMPPFNGLNGMTPPLPSPTPPGLAMPINPSTVPDGKFHIVLNNIPRNIDAKDLKVFIQEIDEAFKFELINFQKSNYVNDDDENIEIFNGLLEMYNYQQSKKLIESLNGYEWFDETLEVGFLPYYWPYFMPFSPISIPSPSSKSGLDRHQVHLNNNNHIYHSNNNSVQDLFNIPPPSTFQSRTSSVSSSTSNANSSTSNLPSTTNSENTTNNSTSNSNLHSSSLTGVPQFLTNFVSSNKAGTNEFMTITNDDGETIKINPCRLFIGNIPFSSTWSNLKNFLIEKAKEFESDNNIEIVRVEIPMNSINRNYQLTESSFREIQQVMTPSNLSEGSNSNSNFNLDIDTDDSFINNKNVSKGFAIVTTGDKNSSDKLIKYFDGIEFEGRTLTVRFDKFPEFNNYTVQNLYPYQKEKTLTNLAFERNSFHRNFYYGNYPHQGQQYQQFQNYSPYQNYQNYQNYKNHPNKHHQNQNYNYPQHIRSHSFSYPQRHQSPRLPIVQPNFIPQIHPSVQYTNINVPRSARKKPRQPVEIDNNINEDERARELVNSFKSLGISS